MAGRHVYVGQGHLDITKTFEARQDADKWALGDESSIDKAQFVDINEAQRATLGDLIQKKRCFIFFRIKVDICANLTIR